MTGTEVEQAKWKSWGIPVSEFIEDVGKYLTDKHKVGDEPVGTDSAEIALRKLDEMLHKYKMFEAGLAEKVNRNRKLFSTLTRNCIETETRRTDPGIQPDFGSDQTFESKQGEYD